MEVENEIDIPVLKVLAIKKEETRKDIDSIENTIKKSDYKNKELILTCIKRIKQIKTWRDYEYPFGFYLKHIEGCHYCNTIKGTAHTNITGVMLSLLTGKAVDDVDSYYINWDVYKYNKVIIAINNESESLNYLTRHIELIKLYLVHLIVVNLSGLKEYYKFNELWDKYEIDKICR